MKETGRRVSICRGSAVFSVLVLWNELRSDYKTDETMGRGKKFAAKKN
jgi:hypothetical protein